MTEELLLGGCLCGAVRYQARERPTASMVCHCRTCTKAAGAAAVPWVTFDTHVFSFTRGTPMEYRSSPPVTRTFCGACGTPLTYVHADRSAEVDVTTRSLDHPSAYPPSHHSWESHKLAWFECGGTLPKHATTKKPVSGSD